jgi:hypothetical protein
LIQTSNYIETQNYYFPTIGLLYPEAGVSNPITFTSSSAWPGSFQLLVVIYDYDSVGNDDLVDRNVFNLVLPTDGTTSSNMAVLGFYSKATFTARIRVSCEQGFSGDDCLTTIPSTTITTTTTTTSTGTSTTTTSATSTSISTSSITSGASTSTASPSSSLPTTTAGPSASVELYAGVGVGIFIIVIIGLVVIVVVINVSICWYQKRSKAPDPPGTYFDLYKLVIFSCSL